ncbi:hypothetical protein AHiyo8_55570 [Arthrobacter sp. Hiyo8]|nr:hypothetical protein AHiyo8_55570 [Arthrobacter sp. Hiyo8]
MATGPAVSKLGFWIRFPTVMGGGAAGPLTSGLSRSSAGFAGSGNWAAITWRTVLTTILPAVCSVTSQFTYAWKLVVVTVRGSVAESKWWKVN